MEVLVPPVKFADIAPLPTAVLLDPAVFEAKAEDPMAVLALEPPVLIAFNPTDKLAPLVPGKT